LARRSFFSTGWTGGAPVQDTDVIPQQKLEILVNEINSLGVKKIDDVELIRKILHSLRRLDYDLVITILYEKEIDTLTPN